MPLRRRRDVSAANRARRAVQPDLTRSGFFPYVQRFLEWTQVSGCSPDTVRRRRSALKRFLLWCAERELSQPQQVTRPILERYKRYLFYYRKQNGEPLSVGSQHVMLTPLRSFFKWLTQENYLLYNPASELAIPKKPRRLPKTILQLEDIERILNGTDVTTVSGLRDRAIIETLYSTGMRRMELAKLSIYDVDPRRGAVSIREGKGRKDRFIPIGERALAWLEKYRLDARPELVIEPDTGVLFLTDYGTPFERDHLTHLVKHYLTKAGIHAVGSCHLFRHACATHMLENGADIRFIQALLGHTDLTTTEIYTRVSIEKLKEIHRATHPATRNAIRPHAVDVVEHETLLTLLDDDDNDELADRAT